MASRKKVRRLSVSQMHLRELPDQRSHTSNDSASSGRRDFLLKLGQHGYTCDSQDYKSVNRSQLLMQQDKLDLDQTPKFVKTQHIQIQKKIEPATDELSNRATTPFSLEYNKENDLSQSQQLIYCENVVMRNSQGASDQPQMKNQGVLQENCTMAEELLNQEIINSPSLEERENPTSLIHLQPCKVTDYDQAPEFVNLGKAIQQNDSTTEVQLMEETTAMLTQDPDKSPCQQMRSEELIQPISCNADDSVSIVITDTELLETIAAFETFSSSLNLSHGKIIEQDADPEYNTNSLNDPDWVPETADIQSVSKYPEQNSLNDPDWVPETADIQSGSKSPEQNSLNDPDWVPETADIQSGSKSPQQNSLNDPDWVPETADIQSRSKSPEPEDPNLNDPDGVLETVDIQTGSKSPEQTILSEEKKKTRKRIADPNEWQDNKNKKNREQGKAYKGWAKGKGQKGLRGPERPERKMGPPCTSKQCEKARDCQKINEKDREEIFTSFWRKMSWDQKKIYVTSLVSSISPKRRTVEDIQKPRRSNTLQYRLKTSDERIMRVCKKMYLSTLGLNEWTVSNWVKNSNSGMLESVTERNNIKRASRNNDNPNKDALIKFLDELPKLPSHYCRKTTSKVYLEPTFANCMSDIYREYVRICETSHPVLKPVSRFTFDITVNEKNIAFQNPKKDRCDTCIGHETKNIEDQIYQQHISNKEKARGEKEQDKKSGDEGKSIVLTMDLQAVKVCPSLNASALYYKTKLCVHNFTIYNVNSRHCRCYWFDETDADLTGNTFASCLIDYLSDITNEQKLPIIIWSDGCNYQNRNSTLSNALLSFSVTKEISIFQKYLEKGHTQMEADSVHATIEKQIKNKPIYLPSDYTRLTLQARRHPQPYEVKTVEYSFSKDFGVNPIYSSIRPGKVKGDPCVTDIRVIKYSQDGTIQVKLDFGKEFIDLPIRRRRQAVKSLSSFSQLRDRKIPIQKKKWLHLQELKEVIPKDCHSFYDNLVYE